MLGRPDPTANGDPTGCGPAPVPTYGGVVPDSTNSNDTTDVPTSTSSPCPAPTSRASCTPCRALFHDRLQHRGQPAVRRPATPGCSSCACTSRPTPAVTVGKRCGRASPPSGDAFHMDWQIHRAATRMRVVLMVSKFGHCLNDLLFRARIGALPVEIAAVVSNHTDFARAGRLVRHPLPPHPGDRGHQAAGRGAAAGAGASTRTSSWWCSPATCRCSPTTCASELSGRIINIHHSFLPSFKGAKPYHQAHARGVKLIGATAHYVTADLDEGPIIEQEVERVGHEVTPEQLVARRPRRGVPGAGARGEVAQRAPRAAQRPTARSSSPDSGGRVIAHDHRCGRADQACRCGRWRCRWGTCSCTWGTRSRRRALGAASVRAVRSADVGVRDAATPGVIRCIPTRGACVAPDTSPRRARIDE